MSKSVMISFRVPLKSLGYEWITEQEAQGKNVSDEIRSLIHKEMLEMNLPLHQAYMIKAWRYDMLLDYLPVNVIEQFKKWIIGHYDGHETETRNQKGRSFHELSSKPTGFIHPSNAELKIRRENHYKRGIKSGAFEEE